MRFMLLSWKPCWGSFWKRPLFGAYLNGSCGAKFGLSLLLGERSSSMSRSLIFLMMDSFPSLDLLLDRLAVGYRTGDWLNKDFFLRKPKRLSCWLLILPGIKLLLNNSYILQVKIRLRINRPYIWSHFFPSFFYFFLQSNIVICLYLLLMSLLVFRYFDSWKSTMKLSNVDWSFASFFLFVKSGFLTSIYLKIKFCFSVRDLTSISFLKVIEVLLQSMHEGL